MKDNSTMQIITQNSSGNASLYRLSDRIVSAKIRMLCEHTFFGLLLQHVIFAVDTEVPTACTDGERIYFGKEFAERLDNDGLYYVMMHELMHIVLGHCIRGQGYNQFAYNVAADIVVNSNIIKELGIDELDLGFAGKLMHIAPNGREGYYYTAEEVYEMLRKLSYCKQKEEGADGDNKNGDNQSQNGEGASLGESSENKDKKKKSGKQPNNAEEEASSKGCNADKDVLSKTSKKARGQAAKEENEYAEQLDNSFKDDHSRWGKADMPEDLEERWKLRIQAAAKTVKELGQGWGDVPSLAKRLLDKIEHPVLDWRVILNNFIQEEVTDYSFSPPDRRFSESPFLLPDFNDAEDCIKNVWVVVDASGSVSDYQLALAINEIDGAIAQYGGRFEGWLSFFDCEVSKPAPFSSADELKKIDVLGGGGTSFVNIFNYRKKEIDFELSCIIIITDGYAPFPKEEAAEGTPVLWVLNNKNVEVPWGVSVVITD